MSEKNIVKIIKDTGYILTQHSLNNDTYEIYFKNEFKKNLCSNIKPELSFFCQTKDFTNIDIIANLSFDNNDLQYIKSPNEAIRAFEWLRDANNNLKRFDYIGHLNCPGYNCPSYMYIAKTALMEDFKNTLLEFKNSYLCAPVNPRKGLFQILKK